MLRVRKGPFVAWDAVSGAVVYDGESLAFARRSCSFRPYQDFLVVRLLDRGPGQARELRALS